MSYTPSVPNSGDSLGSTRSTINTNFQQIDVVNSVNHEAFSTADKGKHKFLQMPERIQAEIPTTAANEGGVYTKVATNPAESNLFFRGESNGKEYQLTRSDQANNLTFATDTNYDAGPPSLNGGWTFLPGGMILQWGVSNNVASTNSQVFTFPIPFPTNVFNIQLTPFTGNTGITSFYVASGFSTSSFTAIKNNNSFSTKFMWQAIGN